MKYIFLNSIGGVLREEGWMDKYGLLLPFPSLLFSSNKDTIEKTRKEIYAKILVIGKIFQRKLHSDLIQNSLS